MATPLPPFVCLFDCDNTLLDNDALKDDLGVRIRTQFGASVEKRFWELYEEVRVTSDVVDIPATIARLSAESGKVLAEQVWALIWDYPFKDRVYPESFATIEYVKQLGAVVGIISDGDQLYQPRKIAQSGLAAAVDGHVKIFVHKQQHLDEIRAWLPGKHVVIVDDKPDILTDIKALEPQFLTTVWVAQGHYATDQEYCCPDIDLKHIGDLRGLTLAQFTQSS